ncbi:MAG TPA: VOC family protein [Longimicrobiales bacterium]
MQFVPYLGFDGQCAEAFRFYHAVLGGELTILTHGESPLADEVPAEWRDRVMNATLVAEGAVLMGGDAPPGEGATPQGFCVAIQVDEPAEAERIFHALLDGGRVTMPLQTTFWAERFGMLVDRYGTPWIVNGLGAAQRGA